MKQLPRGVRNFNPGNVDRGSDRWLGMAEDQSADARFIVFQAPEYGIRCVMRLLITYHERHNLNTIRGVINRWAPPQGKDPATGQAYTQNTDGYINHVAALTGWHPDEPLDLFDRDTNLTLTRAIIRHELGNPKPYGRPEHWYDSATYDKALALAGFQPETKPVAKSRTVQGSVVAAGGAVAGALYESLGETVAGASTAVRSLTFLPENWVHWIFTLIIIAGAARAIYARMDDSKRRLT